MVQDSLPANVTVRGTRYQNFEEVYTLSDFSTRSNKNVGSDEYATVEEIDVPKGEVVYLGQGMAENQQDAIGRLYADIKQGSNSDFSGKVRLCMINSQNQVVRVFSQHSAGTIRSGSSDRSKRRPYALKFPSNPKGIAEPYKLAIQLKTNSGTVTYDDSNTEIELDGYLGQSMN